MHLTSESTERVICIPTVRDRLVQRAIVAYITSRSKFPINNNSSFGFIKGLGPHSAIKRALELRAKYDWCLKTDIQSFFDRIPRRPLKDQVAKALRGNSLQPLIFKAIDCEIQGDSDDKERLRKQGLRAGLGIRQGMPLSPLLANLALSGFDKEVAGRKIGMVRYADDPVLFFRTKDERRTVVSILNYCSAPSNFQSPILQKDRKRRLYLDLIVSIFWAWRLYFWNLRILLLLELVLVR